MSQETDAGNPAPTRSGYLVEGFKDGDVYFHEMSDDEQLATRYCDLLNAYQEARPLVAKSDDTEDLEVLQQMWIDSHPGGRAAAECDWFRVLPVCWINPELVGRLNMSAIPALPRPTHTVVGHGGEEFKFPLLIGSEADAIQYCEELNAYQKTRPPEALDFNALDRLQDWTNKHPGGPVAAGYDSFKVMYLTDPEIAQ
ncbi:hypothetical protein [Pseudomonas oryzihabitans]|uniref:hypothetical protein n=2 Tax=Pseudomonas TaxID=286 RepID=UPI0011A1BEBC|nr:hypothetical protein [Pseudomonas oryzihabitans]